MSRYLDTKQLTAQELIGRAADQVGSYGDLPSRPGHWRGFVPPQTLIA